ncbi:hypothetical protein DLAC_05713 [Tieghemostelium lacteum]|uniref:Uncharacterized protein n=1 Tax=Tieghemostelium lacteum TaxID=361077 RepID=A0A151ZGT8_TIELA|nr:hypothetical protein DLAC_05713 [Tieghemostelium lacteum]|eukprot:KYQ93090.1 hypothetical protein DLAC_05713 [Tieghemostelium lacteum]
MDIPLTAPICIDWGRETTNLTSASGGDCLLLPIRKNIKGGVDYVLLDSGLKSASINISKVLDHILIKSKDSKLIGVILSHLDGDHSGGLDSFVKINDDTDKTYFEDLQFFAHGTTLRSTKKTLLTDIKKFFFDKNPEPDQIDEDASRSVFILTDGKILLRKWDKYNTSKLPSITLYLTSNYKNDNKFQYGTPDLLPIPSSIVVAQSVAKDELLERLKKTTIDGSDENKASIITVFMQNDYHYVFTGDSVIDMVLDYIRFLPRNALQFHLLRCKYNITTPEMAYNKFFNYKVQQGLDLSDPIANEYRQLILDATLVEKWDCFQLPHHGSLRNGIASDALLIELYKDTTEKAQIDFLTWFHHQTRFIFASSPGTDCHIAPGLLNIKDKKQPWILSYPTFYTKDADGVFNYRKNDLFENSGERIILYNQPTYKDKKYAPIILGISPASVPPLQPPMVIPTPANVTPSNIIFKNTISPDLSVDRLQYRTFMGSDTPSLLSFPNENRVNPGYQLQYKSISKGGIQFELVPGNIKLGEAITTITEISGLGSTFSDIVNAFPNLNYKSPDSMKFLNEIIIESFEGSYINSNTSNTCPPLTISNVDYLRVKGKYQPVDTSKSLFSMIRLTSIVMTIEMQRSNESDELELSNISVGGQFKLNSKMDMEVGIDMNLNGECTAIYFRLDKHDKDKMNLSTLTNNLKDTVMEGAPFKNVNFQDNGFVGDISSLIPQFFSIYIHRTTKKYAGLQCLLQFQPIKLSDTFILDDAVVNFEHLNENSTIFGGFKMTKITCSFSFSKVVEKSSTMSSIGILFVSFLQSQDQSKLSAVVKLNKTTSLLDILTFFIGECSTLTEGIPNEIKVFLESLSLTSIGLEIDFKKKVINYFHVIIESIKPIKIFNTNFELTQFVLSYQYNSSGEKTITLASKIGIDGNKVVELTLEKKKSISNQSTWQLVSKYRNNAIKTSSITHDLVNFQSTDASTFFNQITDKFSLQSIFLNLDPSNKKAVLFTSTEALKFAIGYLNKNINILFSFHLNLVRFNPNSNPSTSSNGNAEDAPYLIGDMVNPLKSLSFLLKDEFDIQFMHTSSSLDDKQLSSLFTSCGDVDLIKFVNQYELTRGTTAIALRCKSSLIAEMRQKLTPKDKYQEAADELKFMLAKKPGLFELSASYNCSESMIYFGDVFALKSIVIATSFRGTSITLSFQVTGIIIDGPEISGKMEGTISVGRLSMGLELDFVNWKQPFSIDWLFIEKLALGGSMIVLPSLLLESVKLEGQFDIIPLELQKSVKNQSASQALVMIKEKSPAYIKGKLDLSLVGGDFGMEFTVTDINFERIIRDIFSKDLSSDTLKNITFKTASIKGGKIQNKLDFTCQLEAYICDFGLYLYVHYDISGVKATGALTPIDRFNGNLKLGNSTFIGVTNDEIKKTEDQILSVLPNGVFKNGAAFDLELKPENVKFAISGGLYLYGCQVTFTANISSTSMMISTTLSISDKFKLSVYAALQKTSFVFCSSIEWDINFSSPEISVFGATIFPSINVSTRLNGKLNVFVESSGLTISGGLDFTFNKLSIKIPSFQIKIGSFSTLFQGIVNYIVNNLKDLVLSAFKAIGDIGNYLCKEFSNYINAICGVGKWIGKSANEAKDWLVGKFSAESIKGAFIGVYNLASDVCDSMLGIVTKVINVVTDTVVEAAETVADVASTVASTANKIFNPVNWFMSSGSINGSKPKQPLYSIKGIIIPFASDIESHIVIEESVKLQLLSKVQQLLSSIGFKEMLTGLIDYEKLEITNEYLFKDLKEFSAQITMLYRNNVDLVNEFIKVYRLYRTVSDSVGTGWYHDNINILPKYLSENTNHSEISKYLIVPLISITKAMGALYNCIQPLLVTTEESLDLYQESGGNLTRIYARMISFQHINTSLIYGIKGNGSLVEIGDHIYVVFDSRLHQVTNNVHLFSRKVLKSKVTLKSTDRDTPNFICEGLTIEGSTIVKDEKERYYLLLNGILREISKEAIALFRPSCLRRAKKIEIRDYFIGNYLKVSKSFLQGFCKEIQYQNNVIHFEVSSTDISDILKGCIITVKESSDRFIKISDQVVVRLGNNDFAELISQLPVLKYDLCRTKKNGFSISEYRLPVTHIPPSLAYTILNMLDTLKQDKIVYDNNNNNLSTPIPCDTMLSTNHIKSIPKLDETSSYFYFNHGKIDGQSVYYQHFCRIDKYLFPLDSLTTERNTETELSQKEKEGLTQSSLFIQTRQFMV